MGNLAFAAVAASMLLSVPVEAQPFQYTIGWYTSVRDNVLTLQERQRTRVEALQRRREYRAGAAAAAAVPNPATSTPAVAAR